MTFKRSDLVLSAGKLALSPGFHAAGNKGKC